MQEAPPERSIGHVPDLTARENEILERLERWRDKEIGAALDLSEDGVRYHVKKLFKKLGVRSRFEATHRARSLGILPASNGDLP
ncbi:MAG: LuxR C-terminal-related transcriptional regulator [Gammaproteobacteria bacterium]|nr:LuxR C-terminal-related transcriptional regulator [Gammaproteobacteria bacterium]